MVAQGLFSRFAGWSDHTSSGNVRLDRCSPVPPKAPALEVALFRSSMPRSQESSIVDSDRPAHLEKTMAANRLPRSIR
jgi:hypothetical protein